MRSHYMIDSTQPEVARELKANPRGPHRRCKVDAGESIETHLCIYLND